MSLEDIISLGVLIMFIVIAGLRKGWEQRKTVEQRKEARRTTVDELPEATRRALYGDPAQIPTARRRGEGAPGAEGEEVVVVPMAKPREEERPLPKPRPRPVPQQRPESQQRPVPQVRPQTQQRQPPPQPRPTAQQVRPTVAPARYEETEQGPRKRPPTPRKAPSQVVRDRLGYTASSEAESRAAAQLRQQLPVEPSSQGQFLRSLDDVRRGIILREVLGPPVSLR